MKKNIFLYFDSIIKNEKLDFFMKEINASNLKFIITHVFIETLIIRAGFF